MVQRCCCMSLRTGAVILGGIGVFCSIGILIILGLQPNIIFGENNTEKKYAISQMPTSHITVYMIYAFLCLIANLLLMKGAVQDRHRFLVPWLVLNAIVLIVLIGESVFTIFQSIEGLVFDLITIVLSLYFWCAMFSLYKEIQRKILAEECIVIQSITQAQTV